MAIRVSDIFLLLMVITISYALPSGKRQNKQSGSPGYECVVNNFACSDMSHDNLINEYEDTQTDEGCRQRCVESNGCKW